MCEKLVFNFFLLVCFIMIFLKLQYNHIIIPFFPAIPPMQPLCSLSDSLLIFCNYCYVLCVSVCVRERATERQTHIHTETKRDKREARDPTKKVFLNTYIPFTQSVCYFYVYLGLAICYWIATWSVLPPKRPFIHSQDCQVFCRSLFRGKGLSMLQCPLVQFLLR